MKKVETAVVAFIEFELYHYNQYKQVIDKERKHLMAASAQSTDSVGLMAMERVVQGVERVVQRLGGRYQQFLQLVYTDGISNRFNVSEQLCISVETYYRIRKKLIYAVGLELGIIK